MKLKDKSEELIAFESIVVEELFEGRVVKVIASGKLTRSSYDSFTPELDGLIEAHGKIRIIFEMLNFEGWTLGAAWEDLKFSCKNFNHIERIAIVGDRKWEKAMAIVCKPFTRAELDYYDIGDLEIAMEWISEGL